MQITPMAAPGLNGGNNSYNSARAAADSAKFSQILKEVKGRADKAVNPQDAAALQDAKAAEKRDKELRKACEGFEAMFLNMMYREMRNTVPENTLFGDSNADKILHDMLDTEMVNNMAAAGGVGLADVLYKQLTLEDKARHDMSARAMQPKVAKE